MTTMQLPTFDTCVSQIETAESGDGWLSRCDDSGRFLVPCCELADALTDVLRRLDSDSPILEVCAGDGELAEALVARGLPVAATDAHPSSASAGVLAMPAEAALARYRPAVVLAAFVPIDSGVDEAVMRCPSVRHYVALGPRLGGYFGSAALWWNTAWHGSKLDDVGRWMLTRHDVWLGGEDRRLLRHGEAWHFDRQPSPMLPATAGNSTHQSSMRGAPR